MRYLIVLSAALIAAACATQPTQPGVPESVVFVDASNDRAVPVALYRPASAEGRPPLAIISHGFGVPNLEYGFVATALAERGYLVAAVQHELPGDPPLPDTGNLFTDRLPAWRQGESAILTVMQELMARGEVSAERGAVLIGHSMGGDMAMLTAAENPQGLRAVVSLDNRRVPFPRVSTPRLCSIRSSNFAADPGVLPSAAEARDNDMLIVQGQDLGHDDMLDAGSEDQRRQILDLIFECLDSAEVGHAQR